MFLALVLSGCGVCPSPPAHAGQADVEPLRAALERAYRAAGRCPPCEDPTLSAAAERIARGPWASLPDPLIRQNLLQEAGSGDPAPRALLADGESSAVVAALAERELKVEADDNVAGLALISHGTGVRAVVLRAERKVSLERLPDRVAVGEGLTVRGRLLGRLTDPQLYVEAPDGSVTQIPAAHDANGFHARFVAGTDGRYELEVMARGDHGPEVLYLRSVAVGDASPPRPRSIPNGTDDPEGVLDAINTERQRASAVALSADPRLAKIAQSYAEEMREIGFFGHVSPRSGDLVARLHRAGYLYRRAGENLAEGPSALDAFGLTAESPAHRKTMLDPQYNRCGIGISRVLLGDARSDVILVEIFARDAR